MSEDDIENENLESFDRAIWVLLWKQFTERKHCLCHTIWEVISGVLVFAVFFLVSQTLELEYYHHSGPLSTRSYDINISNILFTPNKSFNLDLMNRVEQKMKEDNYYQSEILHGFRSNDDMYDFAKSHDTNGMVVINFESNAVPTNHFKYSIGKVRSEEKSELYLMLDGYIDVEDVASPSLAQLQWVIDSTFMEQLSNDNITHDIKLQAPLDQVSKELYMIRSFLILCNIVAPLPFFLYKSSRLIIERRSGLKELMKMMRVTPNTLRLSHLIDTAIVGVVYSTLITIFLKVTAKPILPHSDGFIVAVTIILHFVNTTSLTFITSALSQDFNHAESLAMLIYMCTYMLGFMLYTSAESESLMYLIIICCVVPHAPIYVFWGEVIALEAAGEGSNIFNALTQKDEDVITVAFVWLLFFIQLAIIMVLAWYIDLIRPGRYGIPEKWTFVFKKRYWSIKPKRVTFYVTVEKIEVLRDDRYFEKPLKGVDVAIKIVNVSKIFRTSGKQPNMLALNAINLDIYRGEVTVLLGANGSGKSTLFYIITGMYSSTKGQVYINGLYIAHRIQELRKNFGLGPQNNVTFEYLTVRENVQFFEMLNSVKEPHASNANRLLKKLKLIEMADYFSHQLSEGKKRCLQVACTLAGGFDVLVLDEPSTGMDAESRHCLWDIIMELRGHKTVLLATSCLEEADALGDRVALLDGGRLRCHGTPSFLKKAIGAGFNLSISLKDEKHAEYVKHLVETTVPRTTAKIFENKRIIFKLPATQHDRFPQLFDRLEEKKKELGIVLIEVGMFIEEIFLGFVDHQNDDDFFDTSLHDISNQRLEGYHLVMQQIKVLINRSFIYMWRKKTQLIILQVFVPIVSIIYITLTTNAILGYGVMQGAQNGSIVRLLYNTGPYRRSDLLVNLENVSPEIRAVFSTDVRTAHHYPQTVGLEMNEISSTIYYPWDSQTVLSRAVNIFSNIFMAVHLPYLNHSIETDYDDVEIRATDGVVKPKPLLLCVEWAMWIVFLSVLPLAPQILLSIREHVIGSRHNHYTAGCTPLIHWTSKLVAQTAVYIAVVPFTVLFAACLLDFDNTLDQLKFLGCITAMLLAFGPVFLVHIYVLSFFLHVHHATSVIYIMSLVFGIVTPVFLYVLNHMRRTFAWLAVPHTVLTVLAYGSPVFAFSVGVCRLTSTARLNAYCSLNKHLCPNLVVDDLMFSGVVCCESSSSTPYDYFVSFESGLYDICALVVHFFVNSTIVMLCEYRVLPNLGQSIMNYLYKEPEQDYDEPTVTREIEYVRNKMKNHDFEDDAFLVCNLHKHYFVSLMKRNQSRCIIPVRGVSFSVKSGECMCILGPNGAGKTDTLRMLAGCLSMTRGDACVKGNCIRRNRLQYLHKINLISRWPGVDEFLSGEQNLVLFAKLQGYTSHACNRLAREMLAHMKLQPFSSTHVGKYSLGCARRLALCGSLASAPAAALLEDPMAMLDPYTRPLVVRAIKRMLTDATAVVVTGTSLDRAQMEMIFDRVAIMFRGQFAAIGTAEEVTASLATGYSVRIKLRMVTAYKARKDVKIIPSPLKTPLTSNSEDLEIEDSKELKDSREAEDVRNAEDSKKMEDAKKTEDMDDETEAKILSQTSILYAEDVRGLKEDMKEIFPTSELTNEHLCTLYYYVEDFEKQLQYSDLFTKLECLKKRYKRTIEDYTLSVASIEEVYRTLEKEHVKKIVIKKTRLSTI